MCQVIALLTRWWRTSTTNLPALKVGAREGWWRTQAPSTVGTTVTPPAFLSPPILPYLVRNECCVLLRGLLRVPRVAVSQSLLLQLLLPWRSRPHLQLPRNYRGQTALIPARKQTKAVMRRKRTALRSRVYPSALMSRWDAVTNAWCITACQTHRAASVIPPALKRLHVFRPDTYPIVTYLGSPNSRIRTWMNSKGGHIFRVNLLGNCIPRSGGIYPDDRVNIQARRQRHFLSFPRQA